MNRKLVLSLIVAIPAVLIAGNVAEATFIYPTSGINIGGGGALYPVSNLFVPGDITPAETGTHPMNSGAAVVTNSWVTESSGSNDYFPGDPPILHFDLGTATALDAIYVWPYGGTATSGTFQGNSAKTFDLIFRDAGLGILGSVTGLTANPPLPPPGTASLRQSIAISAPALTKFVDMTITDNYFGWPGAYPVADRVGLGQVAFDAVPEPSSMALYLVGAAGMYALARRGKRPERNQ